MYLEIEAIIADLKNRLANEKSLKNRVLLEKAIESVSDYQKQSALRQH